MRELLVQKRSGHVRIFGGGGGVITPRRYTARGYGITRIYCPRTAKTGREGYRGHKIGGRPVPSSRRFSDDWKHALRTTTTSASPLLSLAESGRKDELRLTVRIRTGGNGHRVTEPAARAKARRGQFVRRFFLDRYPGKEPRAPRGSTLQRKDRWRALGHRIRMNAIQFDRVYMRSATYTEIQVVVHQGLQEHNSVLRAAALRPDNHRISGIGQGDAVKSATPNVHLP